jgi:hypothetical protein
MSRLIAVHSLAAGMPRQSRHSHPPLKMACGISGTDEGSGEFTTSDGREARLAYTQTSGEVTCKRCLAALSR